MRLRAPLTDELAKTTPRCAVPGIEAVRARSPAVLVDENQAAVYLGRADDQPFSSAVPAEPRRAATLPGSRAMLRAENFDLGTLSTTLLFTARGVTARPVVIDTSHSASSGHQPPWRRRPAGFFRGGFVR